MTHSDEAGRLSVERTAAGRGLPTAQFVTVSAFGICIPATIALGRAWAAPHPEPRRRCREGCSSCSVPSPPAWSDSSGKTVRAPWA